MSNIDTSKYAIGTVLNADGSAAVKKPSGDMDKESFLKLLVAQLKYHPADPSEFMNQTAQFSILEALQNMSKDQTSMLSAQRSVTATGMLGQKITAAGKATGDADISGVVTGVRITTDGPVLKIGDTEVPLSSVKEVNRA